MPETQEIHGVRKGNGCIHLPAAVLWRCSQPLCSDSESDNRCKLSVSLSVMDKKDRDFALQFYLLTAYLSPQKPSTVHTKKQRWRLSLDNYMAWFNWFQLQHTWKHRNINRSVFFISLLLVSTFWASNVSVYCMNELGPHMLSLIYTHCEGSEQHFLTLSHPGSSADTSLFCDYLQQKKNKHFRCLRAAVPNQ